MSNEDIIAEIISNAEAIKVIVHDTSEAIPLDDQHRLHAIYVLAEDIISKAHEV